MLTFRCHVTLARLIPALVVFTIYTSLPKEVLRCKFWCAWISFWLWNVLRIALFLAQTLWIIFLKPNPVGDLSFLFILFLALSKVYSQLSAAQYDSFAESFIQSPHVGFGLRSGRLLTVTLGCLSSRKSDTELASTTRIFNWTELFLDTLPTSGAGFG